MKTYFLSFFSLLCGALSVLAAPDGERPNVILIIVITIRHISKDGI